jgi:glutaredoxin-dependent peroxiredoxin
MAVTIGSLAPEIRLFSDEKKEVSLSDFKGRNVVIHFFPQAFTSTCTAQLCDARDNLNRYEKLDAQILGISVDSVFTLAQYKAENNYNFPLLSDFNKTVSPAYGAFYENFVFGMKGVARRASFVIDAQGVVQYAEVLESAGDLPNFSAIVATLESLKKLA